MALIKPRSRVRFPSLALLADVVQPGLERLPVTQEVAGSNPVIRASFYPLVAQRIEPRTPKAKMGVRFPPRGHRVFRVDKYLFSFIIMDALNEKL